MWIHRIVNEPATPFLFHLFLLNWQLVFCFVFQFAMTFWYPYYSGQLGQVIFFFLDEAIGFDSSAMVMYSFKDARCVVLPWICSLLWACDELSRNRCLEEYFCENVTVAPSDNRPVNRQEQFRCTIISFRVLLMSCLPISRNWLWPCATFGGKHWISKKYWLISHSKIEGIECWNHVKCSVFVVNEGEKRTHEEGYLCFDFWKIHRAAKWRIYSRCVNRDGFIYLF